MRFRLLVVVLAAASALSAHEAGAQDQRASRDRYADGLISGDYVRLSGGSLTPVNPQGSLRDWGAGSGFSLMWENWSSGAAGVGLIGFGIGVNYGRLALDEERFVSQFRDPLTQAPATSVESAHASVLEIETTLRVRIPSPFIMPSFSIGFGYINYKPGSIHYNTALGPASTAQQTRYGGEFTIGAGLDKNIYDRFAIFGEALYTYGFTSLGQGIARPGGTCTSSSSGCDPLKNTTLGAIRGGVRVRVGR